MDTIKEGQAYKKEYRMLREYYRECKRKEQLEREKKYRKYKNRISKKKFKAFLKIRETGLTNMENIFYVMKLEESFGVILTKQDVFYILKNYRELKKYYK